MAKKWFSWFMLVMMSVQMWQGIPGFFVQNVSAESIINGENLIKNGTFSSRADWTTHRMVINNGSLYYAVDDIDNPSATQMIRITNFDPEQDFKLTFSVAKTWAGAQRVPSVSMQVGNYQTSPITFDNTYNYMLNQRRNFSYTFKGSQIVSNGVAGQTYDLTFSINVQFLAPQTRNNGAQDFAVDNVALHPQEKLFDVNFVNEANTPVSHIQKKKGETLTNTEIPAGPTKVGHTFLGWVRQGTTIRLTGATPITQDTTFVPLYRKNVVTVTFNNENGGSKIWERNISYGTTVNPLPPTALNVALPTKTGHSLIGWKNVATGLEWNFADVVTDSITLEPIFQINTHTVTFVDESDTMIDTKTTNYGLPINDSGITAPTKDGHNFLGWTLDGVSTFDFSTPITGNITLKPLYSKKVYTVKFLDDTNSEITSKSVEHGLQVNTTGITPPDKSGYGFVGWYSGSSLFDFTTPITHDIDLVAKFDKKPIFKNITVTSNNTKNPKYAKAGDRITMRLTLEEADSWADGNRPYFTIGAGSEKTSNLPFFASIPQVTTRIVNYIVQAAENGIVTFTNLVFKDRENNDIVNFVAPYVPTNNIIVDTDIPTVPTIPTQNAQQGQNFAFVVPDATDANGIDTMEIVGNLPTGLTYDTTNKTISGTPNTNGTFDIQLRYTDPAGNESTTTFKLIIALRDADQPNNNPTAKTQEIFWGETLEPANSVESTGLTHGPQYTWQTQPNNQNIGDQTAVVVVTYADGSQDLVNVSIKIKPLADKYAPTGKTITVTKGTTLDTTHAAVAIDTSTTQQIKSYTWETTPSTATLANNLNGKVKVIYDDDSFEFVDVKVNVLDTIIPASAIAEKPAGYTTITFTQGAHGMFKTGVQTVFYVDPTVNVDLWTVAPDSNTTIVYHTGYSFLDWGNGMSPSATYPTDTIFEAQYQLVPANLYHHFESTDGGALPIEVMNLRPDRIDAMFLDVVQPTQPTLLSVWSDASGGGVWTFQGYDRTSYTFDQATSLNAIGKWKFTPAIVTDDTKKLPNYVKVTFVIPPHKGITTDTTVFYVHPLKFVAVDEPLITEKIGYAFVHWDSDSARAFTGDTTINALFATNTIQTQSKIYNLSIAQTGEVVIPDAPSQFITNRSTLPDGTTFVWKNNQVPTILKTHKSDKTATIIAKIPGEPDQEVDVRIEFNDDIPPVIADVATVVATRGEAITDIILDVTDNDYVNLISVEGLPAGLQFNEMDRKIYGTISASAIAQDYTVTVKAEDLMVPNETTKTFTIKVQSQTTKYIPQTQEKTVNVSATNFPFVPADFVTNTSTLPANTTFEWKNGTPPTINISVLGPKTEMIVAKFPDGTHKDLPISIIFHDDIPPVLHHIPDTIDLFVGDDINLQFDALDNNGSPLSEADGLFSGLFYDGDQHRLTGRVPLNTVSQEYTITFKATDDYGNVGTKTITMKIKPLTQKYLPTDQKRTVEVKTPIAQIDPKLSIQNANNLPANTIFAWNMAPDTSEVITDTPASVLITYPDGSSDTITVTFDIVDTQKPVISGPDTITLEVGALDTVAFPIGSGLIVTDNYRTNLVPVCTSIPPFDPRQVGIYTITCTANDGINTGDLFSRTITVTAINKQKIIDLLKKITDDFNDRPTKITNPTADDEAKVKLQEAIDNENLTKNQLDTIFDRYKDIVATRDETPPSGTITGSPTDWTNQSITLTLTTTKPVKTPTGWTPVDGSNSTVFTKLIPQNTTGSLTVSDVFDNTSATITYDVSKIDKEKPVITTLKVEGDQTLIKSASVKINFTATDIGGSAVSQFECQLNSGTFVPCVSDFTVDNLVEGINTITVRVVDGAGNISDSKIINVTKDTIAPDFTGFADVTVDEDTAITPIDIQTDDNTAQITLTSTVPVGLSYNSTLRKIFGTPTQPGTYPISFQARDIVGNVSTKTFTLTVKDITAPVITLNGSQTIALVKGQTYTDLGATCTDNVDTTCTVQTSGSVDIDQVGDYEITYTATDVAGNTSTKKRKVTVVSGETPVITLIGDATIFVELGATYTDAGATAQDQEDGDISAQIITTNLVNSASLGTYEVKYNVSDSSANAAPEMIRTIVVRDTTPPTITAITGVTIDEQQALTPIAVSVVDLNPTLRLSINGAPAGVVFDQATNSFIGTPTVVGVHSITITAIDGANNTSNHIFTITVLDKTPPVITITNPDITPAQMKIVSATATDNHNLPADIRILHAIVDDPLLCQAGLTFVSGSQVSLTREDQNGHYVCFQAVDQAGNTTYQLSSQIQGIDTTLPAPIRLIDHVVVKTRLFGPYQIPTHNGSENLIITSVSPLPDGLRYDPTNGTISGTPSDTAQNTPVTVSYKDAAGNVITSSFMITVSTPIYRGPTSTPTNPTSPSMGSVSTGATTTGAVLTGTIVTGDVQPDRVIYPDSDIFNPTIKDGQCYTRRSLLGIIDSAAIPTSEEFKKALSFLRSYEMTMYDSVEGFDPYRELSRQEAAKIFSQFAINVLCRRPNLALHTQYVDTDNADPTLKPYIELAYQLGIMRGDAQNGRGTFRPWEPISKAEVNAMLIRMILKWYLNEVDQVNMWYDRYNIVATELGIITQGADMNSVLRQYVALMLLRAYRNQIFDWRNVVYYSYVLDSRDTFLSRPLYASERDS